MPINAPRPVEFRSIKQLINRLNANRETEKNQLISVDDLLLPSWQRQLVWTPEDMGLLAYSILSNYPIGMIVLWRRPDGIRVPIDGRQRLTAIRAFVEGQVSIPDLKHIPENFRNTKYRLLDSDSDKVYKQLEMKYREIIDDYEPSIYEYENIDERTAMDIFVKLQGGKSLNKAEIRAALGGRVCDFVTELTSPLVSQDDEEDGAEETVARHPFFQQVNVKDLRKSHRNLCDVMLHEQLYPGQDKHWSSLESMYLDKAKTLTEKEMDNFRNLLGRFHKAVQVDIEGKKTVLPQLRHVFLILTYFKLWKEISETYALPSNFNFSETVREIEQQRKDNSEDPMWIRFNAALSNAGYAANRIETRHKIVASYVFRKYSGISTKDEQRNFTEEQKIAIWDRAGGRCEWSDDNGRCGEAFANFREADADHIVKWKDGGRTSIENGRLLCKYHNRARG